MDLMLLKNNHYMRNLITHLYDFKEFHEFNNSFKAISFAKVLTPKLNINIPKLEAKGI